VGRMPKTLSAPLFCYLEPGNAKHARTVGKKLFGSFSAYVNALIANDRGVKPALGKWKSDGESKALRVKKVDTKKKIVTLEKEPVPALNPWAGDVVPYSDDEVYE
jgi:hypothetical protein